jgi:transcriptional regulator with XRE-family HTH domain
MMQEVLTQGSLKLLRFQPKIPAMNSSLGKIIKSRLIEMRKTQEWLAEECGVSKVAVSKWISTGKISRKNAVAVTRILDITSDRLLLGQPLVDVSPSNETSLERLDGEEKRLLELYRRATKDGRMMIYGAATVAPKESEADHLLPRPQ